MRIPKYILPIIVISQFCCTSLWFAGNGVMDDLVLSYKLANNAVGHLTSAVQLGFIIGTLCFALFTIPDRFSPSLVFLVSATVGSLFNLGLLFQNNNLLSLLFLRFFTGFFLAGIYPVGMKIASDYYEKGLGKSLGFLVGALVLGTASPHLFNDIAKNTSWVSVIYVISGLAFFGGLFIGLFVPDGPYKTPANHIKFVTFLQSFKNPDFRAPALGYFGHMWELYAFWVFVPVILNTFNNNQINIDINISFWSFIIIGTGALSCIISGYLSSYFSARKIAFTALLLSGICCFSVPFILSQESSLILIAFLLFWSVVIIADSPLFSSLIAKSAAKNSRGTALTMVNCIGFSLTIVSIQLLNILYSSTESVFSYVLLALGPLFGLYALYQKTN